MRTIPHRELRNESSRILREVEAGETFEITNHGQVVAVLSPPGGAPKHNLPIQPANPNARFEDLRPGFKADIPSEQIIDELRGDR